MVISSHLTAVVKIAEVVFGILTYLIVVFNGNRWWNN
jgi:hypothetical protein